jgi:DICT domain-containing protein/signal transduction histidine kinase
MLEDLLQLFPKIKAQIYFKAALTAISHAMEDLVLTGGGQPLVIANFQQERFYRQETRRYQRMAQCTDQVYILAAPETNFASAPAPYATIGLEPTDELAQEWHLVIIGQQYSACLICREYAAPVNAISLDSARQFRGFWSFAPEVSRLAARLLFRRIQHYRPDLASQLQQATQNYQLTIAQECVQSPESSESISDWNVRLFIDRLVTYLQAGQYKQVNAYRRIAVQERQERLVNRISAAIRQSLKPEDVLSVMVREVAQLFEHCHCVLYRFPAEISEESQLEFVSVDSSPVKVSTENWHLGSHPQFQPILRRGNSIAIADISQDSGIQAYPDLQKQLQQAQIQACLLVPICYQEKCLAVLELHKAHPHLWSVSDRNLLTAIAIQVGLALVQADAYINLKQLNRQLFAIKQAQNNLIAIVGHELRTPLSTIQVCLESLDTEPEMPLDLQQSMVEAALIESERLRKLIQDFLLLSRLESNLGTWQMEAINLADSISMVVNHLQVTSQMQDVPTILVDVPLTLPLVFADGEALFVLLSKLLDNSCKFTPPSGSVVITVRELSAVQTSENSPSKPMLEVQIADTGNGIEPDQQEEGFMQRAVGGTGLGLAICRQLAKQLGGKIWATSPGKGKGSQFYVTLPVLVE